MLFIPCDNWKTLLSESSRIRQTNSQLCVYMSSPCRGFVTIKTLPRKIYKNTSREDEIDTIFNSPCLFTSNALIQFKSPMLVYEEYFNAGVSIYISHITIFTFATCTQSIWLEALSNVTIAILNCNTL